MLQEKRGWPAVLGINGPPTSGKGWLISRLVELVPDSIVMCVQDGILASMQRHGLADPGLNYAAYKRTPDARRRMIDHAQAERAKDPHVFSRITTESPLYHSGRPVIFDNIGFNDEVDWFKARSSCLLVLRLDTRFLEPEPSKAHGRRFDRHWPGDSRNPVYHDTMLTAYDSQQMWLLLQWLAGPLTRDEAGPYHEIKSTWNRFFAHRESVGDLFAGGRASG